MANLTRMKILTTGATTTAPANIKTGELAYSYVAGTQANNGDRLYIGTGTEVGGVAPNVDVIGGKYFTEMLDHAGGTLTASSAIIVDGNSHINAMNIGTLRIDTSGGTGQTVTSIETTMAGSPTNSQLISALAVKTYVDGQVTAQDLDFGGDTGTGSVDLDSQSLSITGTANEIVTDVPSANNLRIGLPNNVTIGNNLTVTNTLQVNGSTTLGNAAGDTVTTTGDLTVGGDLTVNGEFTTVNSTTVTVDDIILTLGGDTAPVADDNLDRGIEYRYFDGSAKLGFFGFDDSTGRFAFIPDATNTAGVMSGSLGDIDVGGAYVGNVEIGIATDNTITTSSGALALSSATNTVNVSGTLTATTLTLTNDLAVAHGGTGLSSFTGNAVFISNAAGSAISFITGTEGDLIQFNSSGAPIASAIIDGGTY